MNRRSRIGLAAVIGAAIAAIVAAGVAALSASPSARAAEQAVGCQLNSPHGNVKHVIYIQFDNTHFRRDNANVPSDLEQMPNLLGFITGNGTLLGNDHTVLISHTGTGILTSLTGVYPNRMGQPVSNSFRYFTPAGGSRTGVSFAYWTAPLFDPAPGATDTTPEMISENGKIAPAPWVPYTRAGCNFGAVATANTILENTAIDIPTVFGAGSPEATEVAGNPAQGFADFVGIGVHCAQGDALCSDANHGRPDLLPDEPGGYNGYQGLFGAKYVDPQISPSGPMTDLDGNVIQDATNHVGFPGFDGMEATVSLSWVAQMQEHGIPVTYAYISDAHDGHGNAGNIHFAYGPGEAGYVQQLKDYDKAFGKFFPRLAADGIDKSNTLLVFTVDEGDHFVGDPGTPAGCDGGATPCNYNRVGEVNGNLRGLMATAPFNDPTAFSVHSDDAPTVYVNGNPARTDPAVRTLEREMGQLTITNPYTNAVDHIAAGLADPIEENTLHMVTADPFRTPTFTLFADPNYFFFAGAPNCNSPCVTIPARGPGSFAWNHGDIQDEIASTWIGMVGPGVENNGVDGTTWSDHTDLRPTILDLLGLKDDYTHDGRLLSEDLSGFAIPPSVKKTGSYVKLARIYKQLNASFGAFSMDTLKVSTKALESGSTVDDSTYTSLEASLADLTTKRDALASEIKTTLDDVAFNGAALTEAQAKTLIAQAQSLLDQAHTLAS